jgi:hypothetical protein
LNREAETPGFETPEVYRSSISSKRGSEAYVKERKIWRKETVNLKGKARSVYRDIKTGDS